VLVGVLRRNHDAARTHLVEEPLLRRWRAPIQVLIGNPAPIKSPAEIGMLRQHIQDPVDGLRLQFAHLFAVIRETNIQVLLRHDADAPLLLRSEAGGKTAPAHMHRCGAFALPCRNRKLDTLLAEVSRRMQGLDKLSAADLHGNAGGHCVARRQIHKDVDDLFQPLRGRAVEHGGNRERRDAVLVGCRLAVLTELQGVVEDAGVAGGNIAQRDLFVGRSVHGGQCEMVLSLHQPCRRNIDPLFGA